jgi:hypothetical protein
MEGMDSMYGMYVHVLYVLWLVAVHRILDIIHMFVWASWQRRAFALREIDDHAAEHGDGCKSGLMLLLLLMML